MRNACQAALESAVPPGCSTDSTLGMSAEDRDWRLTRKAEEALPARERKWSRFPAGLTPRSARRSTPQKRR
jgi:hypothetical protein